MHENLSSFFKITEQNELNLNGFELIYDRLDSKIITPFEDYITQDIDNNPDNFHYAPKIREKLDLLDYAYKICNNSFAHNIRRNGLPYITHLEGVAVYYIDHFSNLDVKLEKTGDNIEDALKVTLREIDRVIVAVLHDLLEDTNWTIKELSEKFGPEIAYMVAAISKPSLKETLESSQNTQILENEIDFLNREYTDTGEVQKMIEKFSIKRRLDIGGIENIQPSIEQFEKKYNESYQLITPSDKHSYKYWLTIVIQKEKVKFLKTQSVSPGILNKKLEISDRIKIKLFLEQQVKLNRISKSRAKRFYKEKLYKGNWEISKKEHESIQNWKEIKEESKATRDKMYYGRLDSIENIADFLKNIDDGKNPELDFEAIAHSAAEIKSADKCINLEDTENESVKQIWKNLRGLNKLISLIVKTDKKALPPLKEILSIVLNRLQSRYRYEIMAILGDNKSGFYKALCEEIIIEVEDIIQPHLPIAA